MRLNQPDLNESLLFASDVNFSSGQYAARRRFTLERPADGAKLGFVAEADDGATQNYNGMLLSVERRAAKNVTVTANYTWSHCIGDYATFFSPMAMFPSDTYADPNNRRLDHSSCDSDRRLGRICASEKSK
jgi:hypothetical protein